MLNCDVLLIIYYLFLLSCLLKCLFTNHRCQWCMKLLPKYNIVQSWFKHASVDEVLQAFTDVVEYGCLAHLTCFVLHSFFCYDLHNTEHL